MDDAATVNLGKARACLQEEIRDRVNRDPPLTLEHGGKILAVEVFEHHVGDAS